MKDADNLKEVLNGVVDRIIYSDSDTGYAVCNLVCADKLVVIAGNMPLIEEGESISVHGEMRIHDEYGEQFKVITYQKIVDRSLHELEKFLCSGIIRGIGAATAKKIVKAYGADAFAVICESPERLSELKGISPQIAKELHKAFAESKDAHGLCKFLIKYNIPASFIVKLYRKYGKNCEAMLAQNPYDCVCEAEGLPFSKIDELAKRMHIGANDPRRIRAAILHTMELLLGKGYRCCEIYELLKQDWLKNSEIEPFLCKTTLDKMTADGSLKLLRMDIAEYVALPHIYELDMEIAAQLLHYNKQPVDESIDATALIESAEQELDLKLSKQQRAAAQTALSHNACIINGPIDSGKTTIAKVITHALRKLKHEVQIIAPNKHQSRILSNRYGFNVMPACEINVSNCNAVIIEEAEFFNAAAFHNLLQSLPNNCRLIMLGDRHRRTIPHGNPFMEVYRSQVFKAANIHEIHKQQPENYMASNALRLYKSLPFIMGKNNFYYIKSRDDKRTVETVRDLCIKRLPIAYKVQPHEIQVITTFDRYELGSKRLNTLLQKDVNPKATGIGECVIKEATFRVGDKVVHTSTIGEALYGEVGYIVSADEQSVTVNYSGTKCNYNQHELRQLSHAYALPHTQCLTQHKIVILVLSAFINKNFTRDWLYMAMASALQLFIIIGPEVTLQCTQLNENYHYQETILRNALRGLLPT